MHYGEGLAGWGPRLISLRFFPAGLESQRMPRAVTQPRSLSPRPQARSPWSVPCAPVLLGGGGALDQVIAVNGGGHAGLGQPGGDELQHRHLGGRILHRHSVCADRGVVTQRVRRQMCFMLWQRRPLTY